MIGRLAIVLSLAGLFASTARADITFLRSDMDFVAARDVAFDRDGATIRFWDSAGGYLARDARDPTRWHLRGWREYTADYAGGGGWTSFSTGAADSVLEVSHTIANRTADEFVGYVITLRGATLEAGSLTLEGVGGRVDIEPFLDELGGPSSVIRIDFEEPVGIGETFALSYGMDLSGRFAGVEDFAVLPEPSILAGVAAGALVALRKRRR